MLVHASTADGDQMKLSDSFMLGGRTSYVSRHQPAGYSSPRTTNKKRSASSGTRLDQDSDWYQRRYRLPYQLLARHLRNDDRRSSQPQGHEENIKVSSHEIGQGRTEVNDREELGQRQQDAER